MYILINQFNDTFYSGSYHECLEYAKSHKNEMGAFYNIKRER